VARRGGRAAKVIAARSAESIDNRPYATNLGRRGRMLVT